MKRRTGCVSWFATLVALTAAGAMAEVPSFDRVRVLSTPRAIDDVELTNQDGEPASLADLNDRVALVFFGFTNCTDVCPLTMEHFKRFHASDGVDMSQVAFVLISVDGERDTPEVMKDYLARFSSDFIGLTGAPARVERLSEQFSASFFKQGHGEHYNVSHSPQSFVLDTNGMLRAEFYSPSIEAMTGVTQALLAEAE